MTRAGVVDFRGYRTHYRVSGDPEPGTLPLLCLHGGTGSSSAYFAPLEQLPGRQVVACDQLGCGDSDRPDDVEWSVDACTPAIAGTLVGGIRGAEHAVFEHSAHIPFVEQRERYRAVLVDFLERAEG